MAIPNLFQKSDANLAAMAYKMTAAQKPADMSRVFERMANSYDRTMQATTQAWGKVIQSVTPLLEHAGQNFAYNRKMMATGEATYFQNDDKTNMFMDGFTRMVPNKKYVDPDPDGLKYKQYQATMIGAGNENLIISEDDWKNQNSTEPKEVEEHFMGLNEISDELRKTWTQGKPLSKENRARRLELQKLKEQRFGEINLIENGLKTLGQTMAAGNYSEQALHLKSNDARLLAASSAMFNPSGMTSEGEFAGDYVDFGRDKSGRLTLNLYNKNGQQVLKDPLKGGPNSPPVSIAADELPTLLKPKMTSQQLAPIMQGTKALVETLSEPGANTQAANDAFDARWKQMDLSGDALLTFATTETGIYEGQSSSILNQALGNDGKGGKISATIWTGLSDVLDPGDEPDSLKVPIDPKTNQPLDIDLGPDGVFNQDDLLRGDKVGAANYTKIVSMLTNPDDTFYDERRTNQWLRESLKAVLGERAKVNRGEKLARYSWWGEMNTNAERHSQAVGNNLLTAIRAGNIDNLVLPPSGKRGKTGVLKWIDVKNEDRGMQLVRDGEDPIKFNHKSNKDIVSLMLHEGVLQPHINMMMKIKNPNTDEVMFDFRQENPLWGAAQGVQSGFGGDGAFKDSNALLNDLIGN